MNLLDQIKPENNTTKKIETQIQEPIVSEIPEIPEQKIVTVQSLDSGEVQEFQTTQPSQPTQISDYSIYNVESFCYKYLIYSKEFTTLYRMSQEHSKKFSTELESIIGNNNDKKNKEIIEYLDRTYSKINFTMDVIIQDEIDKKNITIKDGLHFDDKTVIVPESYNFVIDSILQGIEHSFNRIQFANIIRTSRSIQPANEFKILYTNQQYCHACKFFSVCDETKIK